MGEGGVLKCLAFPDYGVQVAISEQDEVVEAPVASGLGEALGERIEAGRRGRTNLRLPARTANDLIECLSLKKLSPSCSHQEESPRNTR